MNDTIFSHSFVMSNFYAVDIILYSGADEPQLADSILTNRVNRQLIQILLIVTNLHHCHVQLILT